MYRLTVSFVQLVAAVVHHDVIRHGQQAHVHLLSLASRRLAEHQNPPLLLVRDEQVVLAGKRTKLEVNIPGLGMNQCSS